MIGVIAGDIIGSVHEYIATKTDDFPLFDDRSRFTDDTVLTVATAYAILNGVPYERAYRDFGRRYPNAGYGGSFYQWLFASDPQPYNSWGNGSAMRVAPVGFAFDTADAVLREAERSATVTHVAHAYYREVPGSIVREVRSRLPAEFLEVLDAFEQAFPQPAR